MQPTNVTEFGRMQAAARLTEQRGRIKSSRNRLLAAAPVFGAPSLRLTVREDPSVDTMETDGTYLDYNPAYTEQWSIHQLYSLIAHETVHCMAQHPYRMQNRDSEVWNEATDVVVQRILHNTRFDDGTPVFDLPPNRMDDRIAEFGEMMAEDIYPYLLREKRERQKNGESEQPSGGAPYPTIRPAPPEAQTEGGNEPGEGDGQSNQQGQGQGQSQQQSPPLTAEDWQIIATQAATATRKRGLLPGDLARMIDESRKARISWAERLRRFMLHNLPKRSSWSHPNRRFIHMGWYFPGKIRENMPRVAIVIDTSGSMSQEDLDRAAPEVTGVIQQTRPEAVDVISCDAQVHTCQTFRPDQPIKLTLNGGGGTAFTPAFDFIKDRQKRYGYRYGCILFFTDLMGDNPPNPRIPTLWLTEPTSQLKGPFGETIRLPA